MHKLFLLLIVGLLIISTAPAYADLNIDDARQFLYKKNVEEASAQAFNLKGIKKVFWTSTLMSDASDKQIGEELKQLGIPVKHAIPTTLAADEACVDVNVIKYSSDTVGLELSVRQMCYLQRDLSHPFFGANLLRYSVTQTGRRIYSCAGCNIEIYHQFFQSKCVGEITLAPYSSRLTY